MYYSNTYAKKENGMKLKIEMNISKQSNQPLHITNEETEVLGS